MTNPSLEVDVDYLLNEKEEPEGKENSEGKNKEQVACVSKDTSEENKGKKYFDWKKPRWSDLALFNKIAICAIGSVLMIFILTICFSIVANHLEDALPIGKVFFVLAAVVYQAGPWVGVVSAILGVVLVALGKGEKQIKLGVILAVISFLSRYLVIAVMFISVFFNG